MARLIFIIGTTACGKTAYAIERARQSGGVILSCDSLCVYRGMDIGTAKPTPAEQALVPHFGIDLQDPDKAYSVADYITYRDSLLASLQEEEAPVYVVGGSGFYLKSFFTAVTDNLPVPPEIKAQVLDCAENEGFPAVLDWLKRCNPADGDLADLDTRNPVRVQKALMRCLASGLSYRRLLQDFKRLPPPLPQWEKEVHLIVRNPQEMSERNHARVDLMLQAGLVEEVVGLRKRGFESNPSACRSIGYAEILEYLDGRSDLQAAKERIVLHTQQLMRRQRTWFRQQVFIQ